MTTETITLDKVELDLLCQFMEQLSDRFGNDGCNDMSFPNTEENRALLHAVNTWLDPAEDPIPEVYKGNVLYGSNWIVLDYIRDKIAKQRQGD